MIVTSLKDMPEIRQAHILGLPTAPSLRRLEQGVVRRLHRPHLQRHPRRLLSTRCASLIPSVIVSIIVGAITGYALSFWRPRGAVLLFGMLIAVAFIPYQVFIYPLVRIFSTSASTTRFPASSLVHTIFGLPMMTLIFRNYFAALPEELFKAARVDGAGFWRIFGVIMLPMALPIIVVAVILQVTGIWNDFLFGLVFAGRENLPMTVQLNNIVNSTQGEREYNVDMAATLLTATRAAGRLFRLRPLVRARHRRRRREGLRRWTPAATSRSAASPSATGRSACSSVSTWRSRSREFLVLLGPSGCGKSTLAQRHRRADRDRRRARSGSATTT